MLLFTFADPLNGYATKDEIYLKNIDDDLASAVSLLEKKPTQKPTQKQKEVNQNWLTP